MNAVTDTRRTLSVDEVAGLIGVSRAAVYNAIHDGEIEHIKLGRRVLIPRRAVEDLLGEPIPEPSESETPNHE